MSMLGLLQAAGEPVLDWLYPPRCAACGAALHPGQRWFCEPCLASLEPLSGPRCPVCGAPGTAALCPTCRRAPPPYHQLRSGYCYGGAVAATLRQYKYGGRLDLARPLGALLAPLLPPPEALLVAVPPSRRALRERGFDALHTVLRVARRRAVIARPTRLLRRVDGGPPQASLSARERERLPAAAFRIDARRGDVLEGRAVVLVDDVITTGATVRACSAVLRAGGARRVEVVSLARNR